MARFTDKLQTWMAGFTDKLRVRMGENSESESKPQVKKIGAAKVRAESGAAVKTVFDTGNTVTTSFDTGNEITGTADRTAAELLAYFKQAFHLREVEASSYSPLALAYLGDAVYEVMIRTLVVNAGNMQVSKMHRHGVSLVKAETQARMIQLLEPDLTGEENAVYKRGRNAKSVSGAKNASVIDYRMATGFEALVGYLYLAERLDRLTELVGLGLDRLGEFDGKEG